MVFEVGSKVVYPSHGIAEVVGREEREVDGEKLTYLVLSVPQRGWGTSGGMKVSVPENRAEDLGVREAISEEDAADVLQTLAVTDVRVPSVVVSPFARPDYVSHVVHDHTSILKLLETKFNLPALTDRDGAADNLLDCLDLESAPAFATPPSLPAPRNPSIEVPLCTEPGPIPNPNG